jgi:GT2 family glycosyltransferase
MMSVPPISAVVVAHNGGAALHACVDSLLRQTLADVEILVVDNASSDGSIDELERSSGHRIRTVRLATNLGYAAGANAGARASHGELVAILNQDLVLYPDCLERMRNVLLARGRKTLVTPKLVLKSDPTRVNAVGNDVHLSGVAWCHGLDTPADDWHGTTAVTAVSGAAFLIDSEFLESLHGLEERYFMDLEDVDLSLRARLAGGTCVAACDAVAVHDWQLELEPRRFRLLERNRLMLWRRFWGGHPRTYPVLVQAELMAWGFALIRGVGHLRAKAGGRAPKGAFSTPAPSESQGLYPVLARRHPYEMLFPGRPTLARLGRALDAVFASLVPR